MEIKFYPLVSTLVIIRFHKSTVQYLFIVLARGGYYINKNDSGLVGTRKIMGF